ncbi:uroporphyrinogen-III synthase [Zavarzinia compransoris]|uniref:uroporphyrinogen-III synthase n=1 Tax=Zavarzinia marina TaxID=2911065 RepID=UPI001F3ADB7F|nr:uroporphyrinogen-III synthase [Zavarzinia marina]MCF4165660.1 uroporphyrinogen-III synthase [Zavarzinia marina]
MRLLVTRVAAEAERLAATLSAKGHECVIAPLIDIVQRPDIALDTDGVQALLATSGNGVDGIAAATARRDLPLFAVGDATARRARAAGFATVESAGGNVESLADLVAGRLDPAAGRLIHGAGASLAGDLAGLLGRRGFTVDRITLYDSPAAAALPPEVTKCLASDGFDGFLFFSPRTAATFVTLAADLRPKPAFGAGTAYCLSAAVADALAPLGFGRILVAARPTEIDLLTLIDGTAAPSGT